MNQVTEMLRLAPDASESDAIARLAGLFEMMSGQPGYRSAEVLRRVDDAGLLLVLHAWDRIEDWQAFQASDAKTAFSASRPASLYSFVPCGMNWRLEAGEGEPEGPYLRRELERAQTAPLAGPDVLASATFSYQDADAEYAGATMRLTRLSSAGVHGGGTTPDVIADEVYESVYRYTADRRSAGLAR